MLEIQSTFMYVIIIFYLFKSINSYFYIGILNHIFGILNENRFWPGIWAKYFFSLPQKNLSPEKTEKIFWMIKLTKTPILPNCQVPNGFFGITINFVIQKLKSEHFSLPQFSLVTGFFEVMRENIFHIFQALIILGQNWKISAIVICCLPIIE